MLGIRYAKPPVGDLRFKRAEEYPPWDGVKDATKIGNACPQIDILGDISKMLSFALQVNHDITTIECTHGHLLSYAMWTCKRCYSKCINTHAQKNSSLFFHYLC